jgi:hypothetical protein
MDADCNTSQASINYSLFNFPLKRSGHLSQPGITSYRDLQVLPPEPLQVPQLRVQQKPH